MNNDTDNLFRYERQITFLGLGIDGQKKLAASSALVIGVGGLGSWSAELLARAGVGHLRLVDGDVVELNNLHRQGLYSEDDVNSGRPKTQAAARRLKKINSSIRVEAIVDRVTAGNIEGLSAGIDLIVDGTDNFQTRFIINDFCVKHGRSWVFAGVIGSEAQVMAVIPGKTACLRCIYDSPAPPCVEPTCRAAGAIGPAVSAIASLAAAEAIKILAGKTECVSPYLTKFDLWANTIQRIDATAAAKNINCTCCKQRYFEYLE